MLDNHGPAQAHAPADRFCVLAGEAEAGASSRGEATRTDMVIGINYYMGELSQVKFSARLTAPIGRPPACADSVAPPRNHRLRSGGMACAEKSLDHQNVNVNLSFLYAKGMWRLSGRGRGLAAALQRRCKCRLNSGILHLTWSKALAKVTRFPLSAGSRNAGLVAVPGGAEPGRCGLREGIRFTKDVEIHCTCGDCGNPHVGNAGCRQGWRPGRDMWARGRKDPHRHARIA